jgi:transcriptional regulator with XRE-family HTH domain
MTLTSEAPPALAGNQVERSFLKDLGKRIRLLRIDREINQEQLARAAGMSRNFVSSVERGVHGVDIVRVVRLAVALDVALSDLVPAIPAAMTVEQPVSQTARPWPPPWFGAGSASRADAAAGSEELVGERT